MKIVITNNIVMMADRFVGYPKCEGHFGQSELMDNKSRMLYSVLGYINRVVVANDHNASGRYYCLWRDGPDDGDFSVHSPAAAGFDGNLYPNPQTHRRDTQYSDQGE